MYALQSSQRQAGSGALHRHLRARIEACRFLREEAATSEEKEGWLAEEAGLIDALLGLDRTASPSQEKSPPQRDRYAVGLHDGQSIMMAADHPSTYQRDGRGQD